MISLQYGFLFVHIPKTAGNSVQNILRHYSEDRVVCLQPFQDGVERFEVRSDQYSIHKHSTLADYRRELGADAFGRLFKFCCVRNPWERAISFYFSPHRGEVAWDRAAFVNLVNNIAPCSDFVALEDVPAPGKSPFDNVDFVMRFEQINQDFHKVCERIGIPFQELPVRNKSRRDAVAKYYDLELVDLVARRFRAEIDCFGYEFDAAGF